MTGPASRRPRVALAIHSERLRDALFPPALRSRLDQFADCDFDRVIKNFDTVPAEVLQSTEILLTGWATPIIDDQVLGLMPKLGLIAHTGGSVKHLIGDACWERGITVTSAAVANALPVAEYTVAQILLAGKSALAARELYRKRRSAIDRERELPDVGNYQRTVGIIGASTIGRLVIDRLAPYDFKIILYDPTITAADANALGVRKVDLDQLMSASSIVSVHAPVLPETIGMIGAGQLAAMPDDSTLINTARGALVDHEALRKELLSGRLNAVIDVTTPEPLPAGDPLYDAPNVFLTPHIAGSAGNELHRLAAYAVDEIERFSTGTPARYPVRREDLSRMA